jgi:hypothetical protein
MPPKPTRCGSGISEVRRIFSKLNPLPPFLREASCIINGMSKVAPPVSLALEGKSGVLCANTSRDYHIPKYHSRDCRDFSPLATASQETRDQANSSGLLDECHKEAHQIAYAFLVTKMHAIAGGPQCAPIEIQQAFTPLKCDMPFLHLPISFPSSISLMPTSAAIIPSLTLERIATDTRS